MKDGISNEYRDKGVEAFYKEQGADYENPHEFAILNLLPKALKRLNIEMGKVLDLACGSGEATLALRECGRFQIEGIDPFTYEAYEKRTGSKAERYRFEDIAAGCLSEREYDFIVCSFALHLLEESRLPVFCNALKNISKRLIILTPHKRPVIKEEWGWSLDFEILEDRVRVRSYNRL